MYFGFKICSHLWESNTFDPNCTNDAHETLLYLATMRGHTATVHLLLKNGADINHPAHRDEQAQREKVLQQHLQRDPGVEITEAVIIAAARNRFGGNRAMQLLLYRDASIEITEAVVTTAAENWRSGK